MCIDGWPVNIIIYGLVNMIKKWNTTWCIVDQSQDVCDVLYAIKELTACLESVYGIDIGEIGAVCAAFAAASAKVFPLMPTWPGNQQKIFSDVVKESCNSRMSSISGFF